MLRLENLSCGYGAIRAVEDLSIDVPVGTVLALLGPNGAGKTTSFYMTVGLVKPNGGKVFFDGKDITRMPMHKRARRGIGYLSQEPRLDVTKTVRENVEEAVAETRQLLTKFEEISLKFAEPMSDAEMTKLLDQQAKVQERMQTKPVLQVLPDRFQVLDGRP